MCVCVSVRIRCHKWYSILQMPANFSTVGLSVSRVKIMPSDSELSSDILQPIPLKEWSGLQELLKVDWPLYADYYYWIQNSIKWKKLKPELDLEIYCPHGKYEDDATFVAISSFSTSIQVFTKESSGKKLYEAMISTKRFDWSREITFIGVHEYVQPTLFSALDTLRNDRGIEINYDIPGYFRIKSADEAASVEIKVPEECYLGELDLSHLPVIHSVWPHADKENPENSMKYLEVAMTLNKGVGLFLKEGNVLVSWALQSEWHGLGTVQTLDAYKRRGYAKVVVNALAKRLGEEGISPILSVVVGNTPSENMFASLNWKHNVPATWVTMKKHSPTQSEPL